MPSPDLALSEAGVAFDAFDQPPVGVDGEPDWESMFRGDPVEADGFGTAVPPARFGSRFAFELATEVTYDDNILYSPPGEEVEDVVFRIRPGLFFTTGDAERREFSFAALSYRPTGVVFVDLGDESSFDHDLYAEFGHRGPKLDVTLDAGFRTLSEATVDVSQRTDRQEFDSKVVMEYGFGARTGLRAEAGYSLEDYKVFADNDEWHADVYLTYNVGAKTQLGVGYGVGGLNPEQGDRQRYQRALGRLDWRATGKIGLAAWGGADFRRGGGASETTSVFGLELNGQLREGTVLRVSLGRDIDASALFGSETFVRTAVVAALEQRLGGRFTGVIEVGYEDYDYAADPGSAGGSGGREDKAWFVRPALRYQLREDLSAEVFYVFNENDSTLDPLDFERNQFGASVRYDF